MAFDDDIQTLTISPEQKKWLSEQVERTRITPELLHVYLKKHCGCDIHPAQITCVLNGTSEQIGIEQFNAIVEAFKTIPDAPRVTANPSRLAQIAITPEMREELNALFEETGVEPGFIVRRYKPQNSSLTSTKISNWRTGRNKSADRAEWCNLLTMLRDFKRNHH